MDKRTKEQKGLIGVIVPVYKVEKYIAECIESILAQTYTNFRLILVDDGTPDNAGKICDEYAKKDSRITVIHQENAGVTRARARGVEEAHDCEFITFVDSDDTIKGHFLEQFYNAMNDNVDIVINECKISNGYLPIENYIEHLFTGNLGVKLAPWDKMFRRELFNISTFDIPRNIFVGEDMLMNIRLAFSSRKNAIAVVNKPNIYYYRPNESSITKSFKSTPEYEHIFQQHLSNSIPQDEKKKYFKYTIKNRLVIFNRFWGYRYCVKGMKKSIFHQELSTDIKEYKYKLNFIDRIILNYESFVIRFFAINLKKVQNKLGFKQ